MGGWVGRCWVGNAIVLIGSYLLDQPVASQPLYNHCISTSKPYAQMPMQKINENRLDEHDALAARIFYKLKSSQRMQRTNYSDGRQQSAELPIER